MSYTRGYGNAGGSGGGGGYPASNPGPMYNQAMQSAPQPYGQIPPYNRNSGGWNMPPGPPPHIAPPQHGQNMSPWINNNIPSTFRGYGNAYDNRNQNMNMGMKPNMRMVT